MEQNTSNQSKCKNARGTRDFGPSDIFIRQKIINILTKHFELYGGVQLDTPVIECYDTIKNLYGDEFNKQVYKLDDDNHEKTILRYDLTVPLARYVASNGLVNFKRYQIGKVYRKDDPQISKGRYCEFFQGDFDIVGHDYETMTQDTEILCLINDVLNELLNNDYEIKINNRKLLFDVLTNCNVEYHYFNSICSSLDKLDKTDWTDIKNELLTIKLINVDIVNKISDFVNIVMLFKKENAFDPINFNNKLLIEIYNKKLITDNTFQEIKKLFDNIQYVSKINNLNNKIIFEPLLARGLDYYTGSIFEVVYKDLNIMPSTIVAGGRYDNIIGKLGNQGQIPSIGVSFGIERIVTIIQTKNESENFKFKNSIPKVFIATVGKNMEIHKLGLINEFRKNNINVDFFYNKNPKMRQQFEHVFNKNIPYMVIIGENEITNNTVKVKNIKSHTEEEINKNELFNYLHNMLQ